MSEIFSLYGTKRRVENGYEIVTHRFKADSLYLIKIISSGSKENYKMALTEISGYPMEEWTRIKEVVPVRQENGDYFIEVWFRNPGKQFEEFLKDRWDTLLSIRQMDDASIQLEGSSPLSKASVNISYDALSYLRG